MNCRVIARLDIKGPNLVKGVHLEGLRVLGKPERFAKHYYESGIDELVFMDAVASLYGRNSLLEIIQRTSERTFIPLTVGGGLRSLDDIQSVLRAGADKVALNTAALHNPEIIRQASENFGSSTIVVSIEAKKKEGIYEAYVDNGRQRTRVNVNDWARQVEDLGAGEILLTSIDREGTGLGYEVDMIRKIAKSVSIPVIASGGAGHINHISSAVIDGRADAICLASMLHYGYILDYYTDDDYSAEGNTEFLKSSRVFSKVSCSGVPEIKAHLFGSGIPSRREKTTRQ